MRPKLTMLLAVSALLAACGGGSDGGAYRQLDAADLRVFSCSSEPGYHQYSSLRELNVALKRMSKGCPKPTYKEWRAAFLASLERAGVRWEKQSLVILEEASAAAGTTAQLEVTAPAPDTVKASIVWSDGPAATASAETVVRFAFTVDRAQVRKVAVSGRDADPMVLSIAP